MLTIDILHYFMEKSIVFSIVNTLFTNDIGCQIIVYHKIENKSITYIIKEVYDGNIKSIFIGSSSPHSACGI